MTDIIRTSGNHESELAQLRKLAAENAVTPQAGLPTAEEVRGILQPVPISENLVERAPAEMPAIVRSMHHTAAQALDDAASHLEQEMQSHIALMRDAAVELRIQGDSQALTIEALSTLIRDTHGAFRQQADKLAKFRSGQGNGGQAKG